MDTSRWTRTYEEEGEPARTAHDDPALRKGLRWGRYELLHAIDSGGMGHVFAAFDTQLRRKVALKILRAERLGNGEQATRQLLREARAAARLRHPNVVSVHDAGTEQGQPYLAMELIEGQSLRHWLSTSARPWRQVLDYLLQAGRGLAAAHRAGLVHRDFKPSNVMVGGDGRAQVVDFGLVRRAEPPPSQDAEPREQPQGSAVDTEITDPKPGAAAGTPAYMAPEQHRGQAADPRSDQYSFCLVAMEALSGAMPSHEARGHGPTTVAMLGKREKRVASTADSAYRPLPRWLDRVLRRGLAKDPAQRYESMDDLLACLEAGRGARRRWQLVSATAALGLGLLVGWWWQQREAPPPQAANRLAGIWDGPSQAAMEQAFLRTGLPFAGDSWQRVVSTTDRYVASWSELYDELNSRSTSSLDPAEALGQQACLETRWQELSALLELFLRAEPATVRQATSAVSRLSSVQSCRQPHQLPLPADPEAARRAQALRTQLATTKTLENSGQLQAAQQQAEQAMAEALELDFAPLQGEARLRLAMVKGRLGRRDLMREELLQALSTGVELRYHPLVAEAATFLILSGFARGDFEDAQTWSRMAGAALRGDPRGQDLEAQRRQFLAMAAHSAGHYQLAIRQAQTVLSMLQPDQASRRAATLNSLGLAYRASGDLRRARRYLQLSLQELETLHGSAHPLLAPPLFNLANLLLQESQPGKALPLLRRVLDLAQSNLGPEHRDLAYGLTAYGQALLVLDQPEAATDALERAVQLRANNEGDPMELAQSRFHLARALAASGQQSRALNQAAETANDLKQLGERAAPLLAQVEEWLRSQGSPS